MGTLKLLLLLVVLVILVTIYAFLTSTGLLDLIEKIYTELSIVLGLGDRFKWLVDPLFDPLRYLGAKIDEVVACIIEGLK